MGGAAVNVVKVQCGFVCVSSGWGPHLKVELGLPLTSTGDVVGPFL